MINPVTAMKALSERKVFMDNHPEFFPFIQENFGSKVEQGTQIELKVTTPDGRTKTLQLEVKESDGPFFENVRAIF